MVFALLSRLARVWVTLTYAGVLTIISVTLSRLDPALQARVLEDVSTNVQNLANGSVDTLVTSAFVADAGPEYQWVPGLVFLLAIGELLWGSRRLLVTLVLCHVGATLLIAGWLVAAVDFGWLPTDVASEIDVGMSYAVVGVLGALTPAIPRRWRLAWIGGWLGVAIFAMLANADFAYLGHFVALLLGMLVATRFGPPRPWTPGKLVLLLLGATFGYLVLSNDVPLATAALAGVAGALLGAILTFLATFVRPAATPSDSGDQRNCSEDASIQSERHDSGGSSSSSPGISQS